MSDRIARLFVPMQQDGPPSPPGWPVALHLCSTEFSAMAGHQQQHWIPRAYVAAWADRFSPQGRAYVWIMSKDGTRCTKRSAKQVFRERDLYTIKDAKGNRDLRLEHGLSQLEARFVRVRRDVLEKRLPLSVEDRVAVCLFTAAMHARTPTQRDHLKQQWGKVRDLGERMRQAVERMTPEQRAKLPPHIPSGESLSEEFVRGLATEPLRHSMVPMIEAESTGLANMQLTIVCTEDELGFITSDRPHLIHDPGASKRPWPYNRPGLGFATTEVVLPLSPRQLAIFSWKPTPLYRQPSEPAVVDFINAALRENANKEFIVARGALRRLWFVPAPEHPLRPQALHPSEPT